MQKHLLLPLFLSIGLLMQGCGSKEAAQPETPPAKVSVLNIQPQSVNFSENLPARVQAFRTAEIRPQVGGIIEKVLFTQGSEVKAGQALYKINSETFQADVNSNRASLNKAEAEVARLKVQLERYQQLLPSNAISKQEVSNAQAEYRQALADVAQMKALLTRQNLNLQYATVRAPISGRIGQSFVTEGALVGQGDSNKMATVQQIDKVYVDIKQSISEYERLQTALQNGELSANDQKTFRISNSHGQPYNVTARMLFEDINVDPETGDVTIRIEVNNPERKLLPGMYVRVDINRASVPQALLIPAQAIQRNINGEPQVYVINAKGTADIRPIELGQQYEQYYIANKGLKAGDKVVVEGIERIQPNQKLELSVWKVPVNTTANTSVHAESAATQGAQ
ncbi:AdeA/AdeI family multidrug efflux RND transporter periplasmic adaptor subunit [Acinetobacter bereziniae]|jgi:multidrug efflux system membrane fusion protein|uniref:efflux RND transporter periplasmic adaptor subunit n=1 Tax=Acinetobacter TaxID=469 RepID=UPI0002AEBA22|nr:MULTISPECIES: AdeA/AdeI family multidrug efflux RND transporter periplasmic adaptor subunit [Acinetobacter]ELW78440.1 efflux transporter, RND family, MFP subunit [Acinetobacter sp. WC-743]MBJ8425213.1 AdeA/AdeI family multidrug efflux RND transporter periplasmic adaptor subunit [Acinetobacter bereziniae]MBJ8442337.1 AdeA/AdeI family multidrug efflux RND transporter periplasmic adaptor subunit [Acinetobacter bereziniae]MBJ8452351.1 AdeA/AdeI family multidrug efflux RND transporter periplasmic